MALGLSNGPSGVDPQRGGEIPGLGSSKGGGGGNTRSDGNNIPAQNTRVGDATPSAPINFGDMFLSRAQIETPTDRGFELLKEAMQGIDNGVASSIVPNTFFTYSILIYFFNTGESDAPKAKPKVLHECDGESNIEFNNGGLENGDGTGLAYSNISSATKSIVIKLNYKSLQQMVAEPESAPTYTTKEGEKTPENISEVILHEIIHQVLKIQFGKVGMKEFIEIGGNEHKCDVRMIIMNNTEIIVERMVNLNRAAKGRPSNKLGDEQLIDPRDFKK